MADEALGDSLMSHLAATTTIIAGATISLMPTAAMATNQSIWDGDDPRVSSALKSPDVVVRAEDVTPQDVATGNESPDETPWDYRLVEQRCSNSGDNFCVAYACPQPDQIGYLAERRLEAQPESAWQPYDEVCIAPDLPVVTPGLVLDEVRRIGLPPMSVQAPPETFVNYQTVVYTQADTFARTVTLLGFTVDIEATPLQFLWTYGDGATETTTTAGRPYPATDITHTWTDAHRTFHPSVDVTYQIRFRVGGGAWQTLADTITIQGPDGDVRIREATGMLTNMH
jgi:hypothetical protein